jgi:hypothetical protein
LSDLPKNSGNSDLKIYFGQQNDEDKRKSYDEEQKEFIKKMRADSNSTSQHSDALIAPLDTDPDLEHISSQKSSRSGLKSNKKSAVDVHEWEAMMHRISQKDEMGAHIIRGLSLRHR